MILFCFRSMHTLKCFSKWGLRPIASAPPGSLLEMQVLRPQTSGINNSGGGAQWSGLQKALLVMLTRMQV